MINLYSGNKWLSTRYKEQVQKRSQIISRTAPKWEPTYITKPNQQDTLIQMSGSNSIKGIQNIADEIKEAAQSNYHFNISRFLRGIAFTVVERNNTSNSSYIANNIWYK